MKKLTVSLTLLLIVCLNCGAQRIIKIDSVGKHRGQSLELFSNDTCFIYSWRGMGLPKVKAGMMIIINPPTKRIKRYYLSLNQ